MLDEDCLLTNDTINWKCANIYLQVLNTKNEQSSSVVLNDPEPLGVPKWPQHK